MKHIPLLLVGFFIFFMAGCQEKKKKKTSSSTSNNLCIGAGYYSVPGCPGYIPQGTTSGGSTIGGGSTVGGGSNPYNLVNSNPVNPNWGVKYPGGVPAGNCSAPYAPSEISYTPFETRRATMTIVGKSWYNPTDSAAPNYLNTSSLLKTVSGATQLFSTDSLLKVRFKVLQQPESSSSSPYCYGRQSGASIAGYHKLQFNVQINGIRRDRSVQVEPLGTFTVGVNSCTPAIDLSPFVSTYPGGIYLVVQSVKGNQGYFPPNYNSFGFRDVNSFVDIRSQDCWALDVEVAADGTKIFD